MPQSHPAREIVPACRSISSTAAALAAIIFALGCNDNDRLKTGTGGAEASAAGSAGTNHTGSAGASSAGASNVGSAGIGAVSSAGIGGGAGSTEMSEVAGAGGVNSAGEAGFGGENGGNAGVGAGGVAGDSGSAGAIGVAGNSGGAGAGAVTNCEAGGPPFVVGNYVDPSGAQLILRTASKAATFALLPAGSADPTRPPQLFLVERVCAPGGALIARDQSANYRVDFLQAGSQFAICVSAAVPTLEAALALPAANPAHSADTGCAGHPFTIYSAEAL